MDTRFESRKPIDLVRDSFPKGFFLYAYPVCLLRELSEICANRRSESVSRGQPFFKRDLMPFKVQAANAEDQSKSPVESRTCWASVGRFPLSPAEQRRRKRTYLRKQIRHRKEHRCTLEDLGLRIAKLLEDSRGVGPFGSGADFLLLSHFLWCLRQSCPRNPRLMYCLVRRCIERPTWRSASVNSSRINGTELRIAAKVRHRGQRQAACCFSGR